jgi:hypothetical protein
MFVTEIDSIDQYLWVGTDRLPAIVVTLALAENAFQ